MVHEDLPVIPDVNSVPIGFLNSIINKVKNHIRFFVMDVAEKQEGGWTLIELNDGTMSGLSMNDPDELYKNMCDVLNG